MPVLNVYVSDDTLAQLTWHAQRDSMGRSPEQLAEDAVENAAIGGLAADWRDQLLRDA